MDSANKLALYVVPTQFGKTWACIQTIKRAAPETLHVVFTMNTLMGKDQFTSRVVGDIAAEYGEEAVCCVASKKSNVCKRRFKNTGELGDEIALSMMGRKAPIRVVVMCSHGKRFQEAPEFIDDVMKIMGETSPEKRQKLQLYFDEIHHYANEQNSGGRRVRSLIEGACESELVEKVYGYTATPNAVWGGGIWESIEMAPADYNDENYVGISQLNWVSCESKTLPAEFAASVYDSHPQVFGHMSRVFVPGLKERNTHYAVRDTLLDLDPEIVVIVLNGENKRVYYYRDPENNEHEPRSVELIPVGMEEMCDTIARVLISLNLLERSIVWTGNICVSMGQTLAHKDIGPFTSVLINTHAMDASALYQLLGRATGRYLGWGIDTYPTVYSPIEVKNICEELEYSAKSLAKDFAGKEVTQEVYSTMCPTACPQKKGKREETREPEIKKFLGVEGEAEGQKWFKENIKEKYGGNGPTKTKYGKFVEGFYVRPLGKGPDRTSVLSTEKMYTHRRWNLGSSKENSHKWTWFPCYEDTSDPETLQWWLMYYE